METPTQPTLLLPVVLAAALLLGGSAARAADDTWAIRCHGAGPFPSGWSAATVDQSFGDLDECTDHRMDVAADLLSEFYRLQHAGDLPAAMEFLQTVNLWNASCHCRRALAAAPRMVDRPRPPLPTDSYPAAAERWNRLLHAGH